MPLPAVVGLVERRPDPQIGTAEDARLGVPEEPLQGEAGVSVGEGVRRREVLDQTAADLRCGQGRPHVVLLRPRGVVRINRIAGIRQRLSIYVPASGGPRRRL